MFIYDETPRDKDDHNAGGDNTVLRSMPATGHRSPRRQSSHHHNALHRFRSGYRGAGEAQLPPGRLSMLPSDKLA